MANVTPLLPRFQSLFSGLNSAFGTGAGRWVKRPPKPVDWVQHLEGRGAGMGIAPLRPDNTVRFAAIDLDEPDFRAAHTMQSFIPGPSYIERSRSGNAHIWVFFSDPIEAWVPMGLLREATVAAGKEHVEIFPKNHDFANVRLGNYINLPFHGDKRPTLEPIPYEYADAIQVAHDTWLAPQRLERFLEGVRRNDPDAWRKRAEWLMIEPPASRSSGGNFGAQPNLHMCAEWVIEHAEDNPVMPGHRSIVFFNLAKMLTHWEQIDSDEALEMMRDVNNASPQPVSDYELRRILANVEEHQYRSTGCDDPVFAPYAHPDCPIAHG